MLIADGERKSACGVCGARLGPGVAQAHFLQELQHLYSLTAIPREAAAPSHSLHHQDEDARWEVMYINKTHSSTYRYLIKTKSITILQKRQICRYSQNFNVKKGVTSTRKKNIHFYFDSIMISLYVNRYNLK